MVLYVAIFIFLLFGAFRMARFALNGIRASDEDLVAMSKFTGTKNPKVARMLCWISFPILAAVVVLPCYWMAAELYRGYFA